MKVRIDIDIAQLMGDNMFTIMHHSEMHETDVKDVLFKVQDVADAVKSRLADINFVEGKP
jgi:hypothetical protein